MAKDVHCEEYALGIFGNVYDETGGILPNIVNVYLTETQTGKTWKTVTDDHGFYEFRCPDNGIYNLRFSADGFMNHTVKDLVFVFPNTHRINQVMYLNWGNGHRSSDSTDLLIRVLDAEGNPVSGAVIELDGRVIGETYPCGCTYANPRPGRHLLKVSKRAYQEESATLEVKGRYMNTEFSLRRLKENQ